MNEETIARAYARLFPNESINYSFFVRFSRKFSSYNANVRKTGSNLVFSFSPEWRSVSEEISIGLVQELLRKILRRKAATTTNMQLYGSFIKNLHLAATKTAADDRLLIIFNNVNEKYFSSLIDTPNLRWSGSSKARLASYDYHTDTISVNTAFRDADPDIVAYLLYHEMLHKKLKFSSSGAKTVHHSSEFRRLERSFENREEMERKLESHMKTRRKARSGWLGRLL